MLEVEEDSSVVGVRPLTSEKEIIALHNRDNLIMITEEEEILQELEEAKAEVEELPIIDINAIS